MKLTKTIKTIGTLCIVVTAIVIVIVAARRTKSIDPELAAFEQLETMGISPIRFKRMPEGSFFKEADITKDSAVLTYQNGENTITVTYGHTEENSGSYTVDEKNITLDTELTHDKKNGIYSMSFQYSKCDYSITGKMPKEDFLRMLQSMELKELE